MGDDLVTLIFILLAVASVIAILSGNVLDWARDEWRLMRAHTWADQMPGSATADKKRIEKLSERQRALAKRMKKKGRHLYSGKRYKPVLTTPVAATPTAPPKADKVVRPDFANRRKTNG